MFDVDKIYLMRKDCDIKPNYNKIRKTLFDKLKNSQSGKLSEDLRKSLKDLIDQFILDPYRKESLVNQTTAKGYISIPESAYNILLETYEELLRNPEYLIVKWPKEGRRYRNNKIVDMTFEVLTHEDSADKILNPGGFEQQKDLGYTIAGIKKINSIDQNLSFIDTHVQFYKQNSAAAALIGIFAVHKVAHAFIERDPIYIDFTRASKLRVPMVIGNTVLHTIEEDGVIKHLVKVDPRVDTNGALIGKVLGSLVAASADAAKDPVLNLMNINKDTANILTTAIRLGIPFEDAALLLSQRCMTSILDKLNQDRLNNIPTSLQSIIKDRIDVIKKATGMTKKGATDKILSEGLSREDLYKGLTSVEIGMELKALSYIQALLNVNKELKGITLATRFNSISSAAGPLIVDNLIMEKKMSDFSEFIYGVGEESGVYYKIENIYQILEAHPILQQFSKGYNEAGIIMRDMPLYSSNFGNIIEAMSILGVSSILENRAKLSKFADFYNSYLLIANDVIDPGDCGYYVTKFPKEFFFKKKYKEKYRGNPFIDAMKLDIDPKTGIASIKIDITGLSNAKKDILISGYIDLLNKDKELAIELFKYNFFIGGLGFTPKTFMSLTPLLLKRAIKGYGESFYSEISCDPTEVIDLFIRNNWSNSDFVKFLPPTRKVKNAKTSEIQEVPNFFVNSDDSGLSITISDENLCSRYKSQGYIRTIVNDKEKLFKLDKDEDSEVLIYREVSPLGGKNSYLEFTDTPIKINDNISSEDRSNGIRTRTSEENITPDNEDNPSDPDMELIRLAFKAAGLSEDKVTEKINSFKKKSTEEKRSLKESIENFFARQFTKHNISFNNDTLNRLFNKLC